MYIYIGERFVYIQMFMYIYMFMYVYIYKCLPVPLVMFPAGVSHKI